MPLVSFTTPTLNRPDLHEQLYVGFDADLLPEKELVVFDESQEASPFFLQLTDPRVRYVHQPKAAGLGVAAGAKDKNNETHIGRARNKLVGLARGEFIAHRDDDDFYDPRWGTFALDRLGDADLFKLVCWRSLHEVSGTVFEWDVREMSKQHYAVKGDEYVLVDVDPADFPPHIIDTWKCSFGFTFFGPKRTFERFPFEEDGTEDIPFALSIVAAGGNIVFCDDGAHLVLHRISHRADSIEYPQKIVGTAGLPQVALREAVKRKMIGLMGTMTELEREKPIRVKPGVSYAVLVSVKDKHTLKALATMASRYNVLVYDARDNVEPSEFGINAPPPGYRLVHATATVDAETEMPWKLPSPLSAFDKTRVIRAWADLGPVGVGAPRRAVPGWWWRGR